MPVMPVGWFRDRITILIFFASSCFTRPSAGQDLTPEQIYAQVLVAGADLLDGTEIEKLDAASLLAEMRAVYSVPVLEQALQDPSAMVRMAVVDALGQIAHEDAVDALVLAAHDGNPLVALTAVNALGGMHIDEAYAALMSMLTNEGDPDIEDALLEGLRAWSQPYNALPAPTGLPPGKQVPDFDPAAPAPLEPGQVFKKAKNTIDACNPYDPAAGILLQKCQDLVSPQDPTGKKPSWIDTKNPYGPSSFSAILSGASSDIDVENPYDGIHFPLATSSAVLLAIQAPPLPDITMSPVSMIFAPPLALELWDLHTGSWVGFETATASTGVGTGRMTSMMISGEWAWRFLGAGATIPFGVASGPDGGGREVWLAGNIGLWLRHKGSRDLGAVTLRWGAAMTLNIPSGSRIPAPDDGTLDLRTRAATSLLYGQYYQHGTSYPDLENSFRTSVRPDLDIAVIIGPLALQLEMGFDFIVLGKGLDPDTGASRDLPEVSLLHVGLGAYLRPIGFLQASLEITSVIQLSGTSLITRRFDRDLMGRPAGSEAFIAPGLALLVPLRSAGTLHLTVALRVPLGDIAAVSGPVQLDPVLLLGVGFRFTAPDPPP